MIRRIAPGLFLIALTTLMLELTLIRVFDVIWTPNMAYMVITLAMFCFALSGIYVALRPVKDVANVPRHLAAISLLFGVLALAFLPIMNALPIDFDNLLQHPTHGVVQFILMYGALALPFFLSGLVFTIVFSTYAEAIRTLYFWDLTGAGLGCIILVPLLPHFGPGGMLFIACGFALFASGLFLGNRRWLATSIAAGIMLIVVPLVATDGYLDFVEHTLKRGTKIFRAQGLVERTYWDPISKIDVVNHGSRKDILYDGGSQTSVITRFDGNLRELRKTLPANSFTQFTSPGVLASHVLKEQSDQDVLVIGSAGGQEVKAALTYGAKHVDAVELVGFVVRMGKEIYADYNGNFYNNPNVYYTTGEGRSFLRSTDKKYDIIQIFSNHTSSSIAAGNGAMSPTYLQTAEAYKEYFQHLKEDGILHINHHVYPRMVSTAALAWHRLGRGDFRKHVMVFESASKRFQDNLPTLLIKMQPWTADEAETLKRFFGVAVSLVEDPIEPKRSFLSEDFYTGEFPSNLARNLPFRAGPSTDDNPYFNFLRQTLGELQADPERYLNYSTASLLNSQLLPGFFPQDVAHLIITAVAAVVFILAFVFIPLYFSTAGRSDWPGKGSTLLYFACLGAGFIIIELIFIQLYMKLIGYPLYTYSTVVFALLLSAGIGSYSADKLGIDLSSRWQLPFAGIGIYGGVLLATHQIVFDMFLTTPTAVRILVATASIFPLGLFMGMPLPLGILAIKDQPKGAIPWAWGLNGLFTLVGGLLSVLSSIFLGFKITLLLAICVYGVAYFAFRRVRFVALLTAKAQRLAG